ncbi:MAG: hypothetical protein Q7T49_02760 [bacterium]|nr:hypothetical protein [bacterium]
MAQKIIKIGSSAAVTMPKRSLADLGLKIGDLVTVQINKHQRSVTVEPVISNDNKETITWTKNFIKRYKPALLSLARK